MSTSCIRALIFSGASHSSVNLAMAKKLKLHISDKSSTITCRGDTTLSSPGVTKANIDWHVYSAYPVHCMPLPNADHFEIVS